MAKETRHLQTKGKKRNSRWLLNCDGCEPQWTGGSCVNGRHSLRNVSVVIQVGVVIQVSVAILYVSGWGVPLKIYPSDLPRIILYLFIYLSKRKRKKVTLALKVDLHKETGKMDTVAECTAVQEGTSKVYRDTESTMARRK